jgi:hypothetical protein
MNVNVLDPKLPWLASNAAVELDLLINGDSADLGAVRQLGERLRLALDKPTADQPARGLHVDTETETILGQAFTQAGDDPETILGRLMHRTEEISAQLSSAEAGSGQKSLERLRAFCLALSQSAAAYRQSVIEVRPPHPYRR